MQSKEKTNIKVRKRCAIKVDEKQIKLLGEKKCWN